MFVFLLSLASTAFAANVTLSWDPALPLNTLAPGFLSYNIDLASIYWGFNFSSAKLATLLRPLSPAVLRVGGTAADYCFFLPNTTTPSDGHGNVLLSAAAFDSVVALAQDVNMQLLWNLNGLYFRSNGTNVYDPTGNATALFAHTQSAHPGASLWWSQGNEINFWKRNPPGSKTMAASTLALHKALQNFTVGTTVYGPAFAEFDPDMRTFLNETGAALAGFTAHHYPLKRECSVSAFLERKYVDWMASSMRSGASARKKAGSSALLVLEEIGGAYGGGCEGLSDRFISGFWYLHALGVTAESGWHRLHRQDLAGWSGTGGQSHYQLLGNPGWVSNETLLTPHPDYFTSVLFKQLVGRVVLNATAASPPEANATFFHVFCGSNDGASGGLGGVVIVFGNPTGQPFSLLLGGAGGGGAARTEFIISAANGTLQSDGALLNGELLVVGDRGELPTWPIPGRVLPAGSADCILPPFSYGFVALQNAVAGACAGAQDAREHPGGAAAAARSQK